MPGVSDVGVRSMDRGSCGGWWVADGGSPPLAFGIPHDRVRRMQVRLGHRMGRGTGARSRPVGALA
eukprot:CAMPEP_0115843836 /NCGR_PEP_ID=MMETSP0287-20121206/8520_1 /TAXON_ID=412157 /ORGANISM="Chrysochromulina rotalis, Strain UIO044" /LENGTH=65 /DNA_ID=CAMNT_0003297547 /DNA_START=1 /DNA_END=194 /DNA_ORIENTATION=+